MVDERCEIAGAFQGISQNDLGPRTDVLSACPKAIGMLMLIRSMSPQVLAVDELGGEEEIRALDYALQCGIAVVATVHGGSLEEIIQKPYLEKLMDRKVFSRIVFLYKENGTCQIGRICDGEGNVCTV